MRIQLGNLYDYNEEPRSHTRDDPFNLTDQRFIKILRLKKEKDDSLIELFQYYSEEPLRITALNAKVQVSI